MRFVHHVLAAFAAAALSVVFACQSPPPAPTPEPLPDWVPPGSTITRFSHDQLMKTAVVTIAGGGTGIIPVEPQAGEKFMLNWKLLPGPRWINYVVRDSTGNIEFGLGQLTAVTKGIYGQPVHYFCFGNEFTPPTPARVAVATLFYGKLPDEGTLARLPLTAKLDIGPVDRSELAGVAPTVMSKYAAATIGNSYYSPVFQVPEGATFKVTVRSDAPLDVRVPGRGTEYKQGIQVEIAQATRYHNERAEWAYGNGGFDVKKYDRSDAGKTIEMLVLAKPNNSDVDLPGIYQFKAVNGDEARAHPMEYSITLS